MKILSTNYAKYSDEELCGIVSRKKSDADKAFAELYARHSHKMYSYCLRMTGDANDARDVFQESFIKFYNTIVEKVSFTNAAGYLMTITRNMCINKKRAHRVLLNIEDLDLSTTDTAYENSEMLDLIAAALECLDTDYKEAFILRMYQGQSYDEIAEITGASVSAVKNRVWRAKEKLKTILTPYMEDYLK